MTRDPRQTGPRRAAGALVAALALAALAACGGAGQEGAAGAAPTGPPPELAGTNWDGTPFRLADHRGEVSLLFFGYTFCPDVCPLTLAKMKRVYGLLGERADEVNVVFASVDPRRDTVEKLAGYVPSFDERFFGVRLDEEQLEAAADELDLTVQYGQPRDGPGTDSFYYVDHTGTYFLVGRDGRVQATLPPDATAEEIAPAIEQLLEG